MRQFSAKMNRDYLKEEAYRKNVLSLSKWDFLRQRKAEADAFVAETLRQRRQMTKLLIMRTRHDNIVGLFHKFRARVEEIRMRKVSIMMAMKIKRQTKRILQKYGPTMYARQRHQMKDCIELSSCTVRDTFIKRAKTKVLKFLQASNARYCLQRSLRAYPRFVKYWRDKGVKVNKMVKTRREFLTQAVKRELRIMLQYYQGKKKFKKVMQKLEKIKEVNLNKILDDYFYGVCYEYYKRQMRIWVLLKHKYRRDSAVNVQDRRFIFQQFN